MKRVIMGPASPGSFCAHTVVKRTHIMKNATFERGHQAITVEQENKLLLVSHLWNDGCKTISYGFSDTYGITAVRPNVMTFPIKIE